MNQFRVPMQNIEFKAELRNIDAARRQCGLVKARRQGAMRQVDTYYRLPDGRLKRRESPGLSAQWIFYHRPDRISPRMSNYTILTDEQARRRWGAFSLREWLTVAKTRELWKVGSVRIHLDDVEKLGTYIEFEAMVSRDFDVQECHIAISELRDTFAPVIGEPVSVGYSDLMFQLAA